MMRSDLSTFLPTLGLLGAVLKKIRLRTHKKHQKTQKIYSKDRWHCTWLLNQLFCQLNIVRLLDKVVYHSAPLVARPVHSSWLFSPCSQQLVSAYAHNFTYLDFSFIRHGFPTTLAKGVRIIEGPL